MKFSTRSQYGLRAILNLAQHQEEIPKPLSQISEEEEIPFAYLEQIFAELKKSKLVKGVRGASGGYQLGKRANKITIKKIFNILEGPLVSLSCVGNKEPCKQEDTCKAKKVWQRINKSLNKALDNLTVQDLLEEK